MVWLLAGALVFVWAKLPQESAEKSPADQSMEVVLPVPVQLLLSFSDRYLAANMGALRATIVGGGDLPRHSQSALARIQVDASWLNPGHEDNYYMAAAVLPWTGYVDEAQLVLGRAAKYRVGDVLPPFFYGFDQLYFFGDVEGAVKALRVAEQYGNDAGTRGYFAEMAERWTSRRDDPVFIVNILQKAARNAGNIELRQFLEQQLIRVNGLVVLKHAVSQYVEKHSRPPESLETLISDGLIAELPNDPTGLGYAIRDGSVYLRSPIRTRIDR